MVGLRTCTQECNGIYSVIAKTLVFMLLCHLCMFSNVIGGMLDVFTQELDVTIAFM